MQLGKQKVFFFNSPLDLILIYNNLNNSSLKEDSCFALIEFFFWFDKNTSNIFYLVIFYGFFLIEGFR